MATILFQIIVALNLICGAGNHTQQAQKIANTHAYTITNGVVIIDTDEL